MEINLAYLINKNICNLHVYITETVLAIAIEMDSVNKTARHVQM